MQLWERNTSEGVGRWVLRKTLHLGKLLPEKPGMEKAHIQMLRYAEESNVMFLVIGFSVFMIQLDSLRFKLIFESNLRTTYHPYTNFYAGGNISSLIYFIYFARRLTRFFSYLWACRCWNFAPVLKGWVVFSV